MNPQHSAQVGTVCEIRPATEADLPTLLRLIEMLADFENLRDTMTATGEDLQRHLFGNRPVAEAVIAWCGTEAAGFAVWYETFSTFRGERGLYIEDLFVTADHRSHGVGWQLFREAARVAKQRGCFRLEWEVLRWNEQAVGFYRNLGAVKNQEWDVYTLSGEPLDHLIAQTSPKS